MYRCSSNRYLVLRNKVCTIHAVSHFELGNPLVEVRPALDSHGCYFGHISKEDLDPLVSIVILSRPGARFASSSGFVEPGVGCSVVTGPLANEAKIKVC